MVNNHPFNVIFGSVRYLPGNSQELKCKYILLKLLPMISHFKCTLKMTLVAVDNFLYKRIINLEYETISKIHFVLKSLYFFTEHNIFLKYQKLFKRQSIQDL